MNQGYIDSNSINSQKILMNSDISRRKAPETWLKMATGADDSEHNRLEYT